MSLLARLGFASSPGAPTPTDLLSEVRAHLGRLPPARAEMIAAFAGLLVRVAHAEEGVSDAEDAALRRLVAEHADLGPEDTDAVASLVTSHLDRMAGIGYAQLTRAMNDHATVEEKLHLLDCLYAIATADDVVTVVEEEQIRAVARALMLSHAQLIEVRKRYAAQLEVLRGLPR